MKVNLIKDSTLKKLQAFEVKANRDQLLVQRNGEERVIEFAHEKLVFYVANGAVACAYVPWRDAPIPV